MSAFFEDQLPEWMLSHERIDTHIFKDNQSVNQYVAEEIADLIRERQREGKNKHNNE